MQELHFTAAQSYPAVIQTVKLVTEQYPSLGLSVPGLARQLVSQERYALVRKQIYFCVQVRKLDNPHEFSRSLLLDLQDALHDASWEYNCPDLQILGVSEPLHGRFNVLLTWRIKI